MMITHPYEGMKCSFFKILKKSGQWKSSFNQPKHRLQTKALRQNMIFLHIY